MKRQSSSSANQQQQQQSQKQKCKHDSFVPQTSQYFLKLLHFNENNLWGLQTSHIMVIYFIVQGLAVAGSLNFLDKQKIIRYIKSLQLNSGGFAPSSLYTGYTHNREFNLPHIVFTYCAVNTMKILGALQQINQASCLDSVKACFKSNGSFSNFSTSQQADLRFVYAALAICNAFQSVNILQTDTIKHYIASCFNYDGGYGLRPYCESHAGAVYCALASYTLMGSKIPNSFESLQFLVNLQTVNQIKGIVGVQGRIGKLPDSCYSFWVGASIKMLTCQSLLNLDVQNFLKLCYHNETCSFSKYPLFKGDPLHTLHSLVGLRILKKEDKNINIVQGTTIT